MGARPDRRPADVRVAFQHTLRKEQEEGTMRELWNNFVKDESGQGLVEYVLIIALVAIGLIAIMVIFRNEIGGIFNSIGQTLNNAPGAPY
jgi:pilus assembly protein Flp/PilA